MATSNLLRQSIDLQEGAIPLDDELALLDNYITIQKERTDGRIRFVLEVFDHPQILIPPFTLQPLVENAIKHVPVCRRFPRDRGKDRNQSRGPGRTQVLGTYQ